MDVLNAAFSSDCHLMHLIRLLVFLHQNIMYFCIHIKDTRNVAADALSRDYMSVFFTQVPQTDKQPTRVPLPLVSLLSQDITWSCKRWITQFNTIFSRFSPFPYLKLIGHQNPATKNFVLVFP